jgi:hypothetical protein
MASDLVQQILVCNCGALYSLALRGRNLYTFLALAALAQGNDFICVLTFRGGIKRLIAMHPVRLGFSVPTGISVPPDGSQTET